MKQFYFLATVVILALLAGGCQSVTATESSTPSTTGSGSIPDETQSSGLIQEPPQMANESTSDLNQELTLPDDPVGTNTEALLGTLSLEQDMVEHGSDVDQLTPVINRALIYAEDAIRITEGGEALLDFGDQILMRMFNDTEMEVVSIDYAEDAPPAVVMHLFRGGFTGQLTAEGARAIYETPGGASITILGTEYFITYDPDTGITSAGNFGGTVEVTGAGSSIRLKEGFFVEVPANQPPGPQQPLPLSLVNFEARARTLQSPLTAVDEAGAWLLDVSWGLADEPYEPQVNWSGRFSLEGNEIMGQGTGTISGRGMGFVNMDGQFEFDIGGRLVNNPDGSSTFEIEIMGRDLNLTTSLGENCSDPGFEAACPDAEAYLRWFSTIIVEDVLPNSDPLEVEAADGASALIFLNWSNFTYNSTSLQEKFNHPKTIVEVRSVSGATSSP